MPALNNEIDIVTVGGVDQDIRDTTTRTSIGPTEPLAVASTEHLENEIFYAAADRKLYRAKSTISPGDTFTTGDEGNVEQTTIAQMMYRLFSQSPELLMRCIADYEPTNKASKVYHSGDKVFLGNGILYKVTTRIGKNSSFIIEGDNANVVVADKMYDSITYLDKKKENKKVTLEQRLESGETTVLFADDAIDDTKILRPATSMFGKMPLSMVLDGHSVTMTFKPQSASMTVYLIIEEV